MALSVNGCPSDWHKDRQQLLVAKRSHLVIHGRRHELVGLHVFLNFRHVLWSKTFIDQLSINIVILNIEPL